MGNQEGLILVPYVAPAIELERGLYEASRRDQLKLAIKAKGKIQKALSRSGK
jgi:hypothetical protein